MSLRLSEKHGVNPAVEQCFVCLEDFGVILFGEMKGDVKAPHRVCTGNVCETCQEHMKQGIVLISVRPGSDRTNPYRTGGWCVVREEMVKRAFDEASATEVLAQRLAFIEDEAWDKLGLPR